MALSPIEWISGITATLILVVGYTCGLLLILKYSRKAPNKEAKLQIILTGIVFISLFSAWLSVATSFLSLFFGGPALGRIDAIYIYSWGPPVGVILWVYLVTKLSDRKQVKIIVRCIAVVVGVLFFIIIYAFPLTYSSYTQDPITNPLPDTSYTGLALYLLAVMIIIALLYIGPTYIRNGMKSEDRIVRARGISMGIGAMVFALLAIIDAASKAFTEVPLAIVRLIILLSILLIYLGVSLPTFYKKMWKIPVG